MSTDFFDEDLEAVSEPGRKDPQPGLPSTDVTVKPASDLDLDRLMRQKQELDGRVAGATQEIDQLRKRQHELEARKTHMEELAHKQTSYEQGKREIIAQLDRSIILLEKDEIQAARMVDLLLEIRQRFKAALEEIRAIDEESWDDAVFEEELNKAIVRVEEASILHKKGLSRIDVTGGHRKGTAVKRVLEDVPETGSLTVVSHGFGYWLKAGLGFSLPLITIAVILFVVYLFLIGVV